MKKLERNLTKGSVFKNLLIFAIPLVLSNFIQSVYAVSDTIFIGQFAPLESLAGVNSGSQLIIFVVNAVVGLTVGATVLTGQYLAQSKEKDIKDTIGTLFSVLMIIAVILTAATPFIAKPLLRAIQTPAGKTFDEAYIYFFTSMMGTVFVFAYNALAAVMRGLGDSKHPLIFVVISGVLDVGMNFVCVALLGMGAFGAAVSTVVAQAISAILCVIFLVKNKFVFDFKFKSFKIKTEKLKLFLKIGLPTMINNITVSISFLFLVALANSLGSVESAVVGSVAKINGFAILPAIAISTSVSAIVSQNIGAGLQKRAKETFYVGTIMAFALSAAAFLLIRFLGGSVLKIFASDSEFGNKTIEDLTLFYNSGWEYLKSFSWDYLIIPFVFSLNGLFIGTGNTILSLINGITSSILFRIPACFFFGITMNMGLEGIGLGAPIASAASLTLGLVFFFSGKWKKSVL